MANKIAPRMERRGGGEFNRLARLNPRWEVIEPAMTVGSNILAEIPAYAAGMTELNQTGLPSEGMRRFEEVSEMLTYSPRTMEGQAGLQSLTNGVMKVMDALGVDEAINYLNNTIVPNLQKTFGEEGAREIGSSVMMAIPFVRKVPGIKAFHGSPHDFDEFSTAQIGTGEGAQAYGHGLYFAGSEDVAKGYRDALEKGSKEAQAAEKLGMGRTYETDLFVKQLADNDGDIAKTQQQLKGYAESFLQDGDRKTHGSLMALHERVSEKFPQGGELDLSDAHGKVYEVDIDASPDEFLDWDAPLSEQSERVRGAVSEYMPERGMTVTDADWSSRYVSPSDDVSGSAALQLIGEGAESRLASKGIKGIRYKDALSRGKDGGTYNYVIFDDRLISIAKKYGIAIPAAAALLSQETGLNPSSLYEDDNSV